MKRVSTALAWIAAVIVVGLGVLNWSTLMADAPLNLVVAQVQAPLGVVVIGMAGVLLALFFVAYLRNQISSLLETRKLLVEVQRVQALADKAEASRIDNLQHLMVTEFRMLNERLSATAPMPSAPEGKADQAFRPMGLTELVTGRGHA